VNSGRRGHAELICLSALKILVVRKIRKIWRM